MSTLPNRARVAPVAASALPSALRALEAEKAGLDALLAALQNGLGGPFQAAIDLLAGATGRVIVTGMGKSGHVGRKIAATFSSTGTPAYFVHPAEASHGDLGSIQADDVILALSWSGETAELSDLVAYARRFRVGLIAITANADSALGREADVCLTLPKAREACPNGLAPTTSTTMQLALGDALAVALLEGRAFSSQDFRVFHPGGKLGAQLKQVRAVMHTGDRLPLVPRGLVMSEALVRMSQKGFGCVVVTEADGAIAGIVTDGDLRRHMQPDLMSRTVDEVMTPNPTTAPPTLLVAEALEIVETRKIGALIVAEEGKPVGLVHVLDLLRIGAA
ncbi:KpsF/GutQ family sugar-phosphate isomerase [Alsobacter soli]|uniref:KpsF/GutQ family sugar-phosphate isomerase n=1 Tax=Alsobacter soli TaxID=2109933 RepID=A0A2T1HZR5_9HYPH|nr:KpsF/GutQ family sugar-phosphate isomerase [Alsobacter soli]PSC07125.1 KpsF/GutQ family sugar-phosphate isomerase [Alsobacter soli]